MSDSTVATKIVTMGTLPYPGCPWENGSGMPRRLRLLPLAVLLIGLLAGARTAAAQGPNAQPDSDVMAAVQAEREPMIATMRDLVSIESGSRDPGRPPRDGRASRRAPARSGGRGGTGVARRSVRHGRHPGGDWAERRRPLPRHRHGADPAACPHGHRLPARPACRPAVSRHRRPRLRPWHRRRQAGRCADPARPVRAARARLRRLRAHHGADQRRRRGEFCRITPSAHGAWRGA